MRLFSVTLQATPSMAIRVFQDPNYIDSTPDYSVHTIRDMTLRSGANIVEQNLLIDPSGVVYAITRQSGGRGHGDDSTVQRALILQVIWWGAQPTSHRRRMPWASISSC